MTSLGLPAGALLSSAWTNLPANSELLLDASVPTHASWALPSNTGIIRMIKSINATRGLIEYYGKTGDVADYRMYVTTDGAPTGVWVKNLTNADIQQGRIPTLVCAPNQITNYTLTFPKAFLSAPKVMVTLNSSTTSAKYGSILPFVKNVTLTSCVVCVANNADIQFSPNVDWFAADL